MISVYLMLYPAPAQLQLAVAVGRSGLMKTEIVLERERYSTQGKAGEVNVVEVPKA